MKRFLILSSLLLALTGSISSCNNCKKCHAQIGLGSANVSSPSQEMCGDELKRAQSTPGMVCE